MVITNQQLTHFMKLKPNKMGKLVVKPVKTIEKSYGYD